METVGFKDAGLTAKQIHQARADGRVIIYNQPHWFRGQQDIFVAGCMKGSLDGVIFGIDHHYNESPLGTEEEASLELYDDDVALHFRLTLKPGHIEKLAGRDEASAAYVVHSSEMRNRVRYITRASLIEISAVHVGSLRQSHCIVRDARTVGLLKDDARNSFSSDGAAQKFLAALRNLDK